MAKENVKQLTEPLQIGDVLSGDYTEIEEDGSIKAVGDATGWDDLRFPASSVNRGPTGTDLVDFKGGKVIEFDKTGTPTITFVAQLPHGYKIGTDLIPHIHFTLPTAGAGGGVENIKFDLTYSWAEIGGAFPAETTVSLTGDVQNASADNHGYSGFGTDVLSSSMASGSIRVSPMLVCSLSRDNSVANNYNDSALLIEFDFHIEIDQERGSRTETSK